jgi:hypothetical protein
MAGVKGRSGTNKGKDKPWADALRIAAHRIDDEGRQRLMKIAEQCVRAAEGGDIQAIKEIGDRLDGKAHQTFETEGEIVHRYVADVPTVSTTTDEWHEQYAPKHSVQ